MCLDGITIIHDVETYFNIDIEDVEARKINLVGALLIQYGRKFKNLTLPFLEKHVMLLSLFHFTNIGKHTSQPKHISNRN